MPYDPATTAAAIAQLAAQADDLKFTITNKVTSLRLYQPGRFPAALSLAPKADETAYLVWYAMLYRRLLFSGGLVVGLVNVGIAEGLLVEDAQFRVAMYDVKHPVNEYTPGGRGVKSGP